MVALGNGSDQVPLVLLSRFAMRRVAVCNQSLNRSTACSAPSKARNSQPCEDSDAPNCEVYDSVLTHVLGQVDRNILFCAPACTESAISMSIRCSYSQPPRQPRSASALFALGHWLFTRASPSCSVAVACALMRWSLCWDLSTVGCDRNRMPLLSKASNVVQNIFLHLQHHGHLEEDIADVAESES